MRSIGWLATALWVAAAAGQDDPAKWVRPGENLALGKTYTLFPAPSYGLCRDADDKVQLTDGVYTKGHFWTQKTTVGWQNGQNPRTVIDLGEVQPIGGVSYHTAAGKAGVEWPITIRMFVSDDQQEWYEAGELVALAALQAEPPKSYSDHRFWTDALACRGRYLALVVQPRAEFTFVDEIEVYRGPEALLHQPRTGQASSDLEAALLSRRFRADIEAEVELIRANLAAATIPAAERQRLGKLLDEAAAGLTEVRGVTGTEPAMLPYGDPHRRVLAVQAALYRARGMSGVMAWNACAWDPVQPLSPPSDAAAVDLTSARGEVRGVAVNLVNTGEQAVTAVPRVEGLPAGAVTVKEVVYTAVKDHAPMGSALVDVTGGVELPAGMTVQLWLSCDSRKLAAGRYEGAVNLELGAKLLRVPLRWRVAEVVLPDRLSLALGGWDYTDGPSRGITADNLEPTVEFLRRYGLDSPWATAAVMPYGKYDADGRQTQPPDTTRMDAWLARWPNCRYYGVFNHAQETVADTPAAQRKVAEWIRFWVAHLKSKGVQPNQLLLHVVDETCNQEQDERIVSYAKVFREAAPEVLIFNDPIWPTPGEVLPECLEVSGMLCPNRVRWQGQREAYEQVYLPQRDAGRLMAFYSCSGPVRHLDPYAYHRLQAWECFRYGGVFEGFWAFGDTGGGSSWNEYTTPGTSFAPQFLGPDGCTTSKHMEAIREGRQDYEYFVILRDAVDQAAQRGAQGAALDTARKLLADGPAAVTDAAGVTDIQWLAAKDRSLADQVRLEVLAAIEALRG